MKRILSPLNRLEGDLTVEIDIDGGVVRDARVSGVMYRGFERIMRNRYPEDALVYTPRICGICSVSHSVAASRALEAICEEINISSDGMIARNIVHAVETVMSHVTQFYLYLVPDMLSDTFSLNGFKDLIAERMGYGGSSFKKIFAERKRFLEILGIVAGKWPHTLAIHPSGVTKSLNLSDVIRIKGVLESFVDVLEETLYGVELAKLVEISNEDQLLDYAESMDSDLSIFIKFCRKADILDLGKGPGNFICGGAFYDGDNYLFRPGVVLNGSVKDFDPFKVKESIENSFFNATKEVETPFDDFSEPFPYKKGAYSWVKAPRYSGHVVEVGPLARLVISERSLFKDLFTKYGSTVYTRVMARIFEAAYILLALRKWLDKLSFGNNYFGDYKLKSKGTGVGITEAARGLLMHWLCVENGVIKNYQVISPTTWNCSPRDDMDNPGALEMALMGVPAEDGDLSYVNLVIRSFDPCLVCSVH